MTNIDEVYRNLTGVDIEMQRLLWDERGKGYYGEYLVFKELYPKLSGCCKILMNLQVPAGDGRSTEIDLLLIHETGLYVFEMKHYKGTIYGTSHEQKWTQYFRTAPNSRFYNPVLQNQYHIKALQKMFPGIPVHSFIVFTSPECDLRVECNERDITVCQLGNLYIPLHLLETRDKIFDINRIDGIFNELATFSPMTVKNVSVEGEPVPFHQYLNKIIKDYHDEKENVKNSFLAAEKTERKKTVGAMIAAAIVCIVCIVLSVFACFQYRTYADGEIAVAEQELNEFAKKFEHVGPYNNGNIVMADGFVTASDVRLSQSIDVEDAVNLYFTLNWNGEYYGANISRNVKIIVILKDGSVKEYNLLESSFPYSNYDLRLGKGNSWYSAYTTYEFPVHELSGLKIGDISYIKLSGLDVWVTEDGGVKPVLIGTGYEVRIY